ncbi:MAG: hypothetical protein OWQ57_11965, partial [Sulfobacillus sp.]|nr:hypothetical protein [Sulfobacillus sp.]
PWTSPFMVASDRQTNMSQSTIVVQHLMMGVIGGGETTANTQENDSIILRFFPLYKLLKIVSRPTTLWRLTLAIT